MFFSRSNGKSTFEREKIIAALASVTARDLLSMYDGRANHETAPSPLPLPRRPPPPAAHALSPRRGGCCSLNLRKILPCGSARK